MPMGKAITSPKQFRLMQGVANGMKPRSIGPSPDVAQKLLSETSPMRKKKLAMGFKPGKMG